ETRISRRVAAISDNFIKIDNLGAERLEIKSLFTKPCEQNRLRRAFYSQVIQQATEPRQTTGLPAIGAAKFGKRLRNSRSKTINLHEFESRSSLPRRHRSPRPLYGRRPSLAVRPSRSSARLRRNGRCALRPRIKT